MEWRSTSNAATKYGILAENLAALTRNDASYAYLADDAVKSKHGVLDLVRFSMLISKTSIAD